jgi:hypothetical protein
VTAACPARKEQRELERRKKNCNFDKESEWSESHISINTTWPEMRDVIKSQPVVILPIGSVEDHGPHLPIDTDNFLIWSICEAAAQAAPGETADAANPVRI